MNEPKREPKPQAPERERHGYLGGTIRAWWTRMAHHRDGASTRAYRRVNSPRYREMMIQKPPFTEQRAYRGGKPRSLRVVW